MSASQIFIVFSANFLILFPVASIADPPLQSTYTAAPLVAPAFTQYSNLKWTDPSYGAEISNMPRVRTQGGLPSCYGCASATIVQKFLCDVDPSVKTLAKRCEDIPAEVTVSQLSMVAWADTNILRKDDDPENTNQSAGLSRNHANIKLWEDTTVYSSGVNALENSLAMFRFMPESCFPVGRLEAKYGNNSDALREPYLHAKAVYEKHKADGSSGEICNECIARLNSDFNASFSSAAWQSAIQKRTFGEFLYALFFHGCKPFTSKAGLRPTLHLMPRGSEEHLPKSEVFDVVKSVLDKGRPILVNAVCMNVDATSGKCLIKHSIVLSGYRRDCTNGSPDKTCRTLVKLHNCWGEAWQKNNGNGWVDAEQFIKYLNPGKPYIEKGELSWLDW